MKEGSLVGEVVPASGAWAVTLLGQGNSLCTLSLKDYRHLWLWQCMGEHLLTARHLCQHLWFLEVSDGIAVERAQHSAKPSFYDWKHLPLLPLTLGHFGCCLPCNQYSCFYSHTGNSSKELIWLNFLLTGDALFSLSIPDLVPQAMARIQGSW